MKKRNIKIMVNQPEGATIPVYSTPRSSGCDVTCLEGFVLFPNERKLIHTGIFMQLPEDVECQVRPRSGLALKYGITVLNAPGTIDSDYQGECNVILINTSNDAYTFKKGERIAQFVFAENVVQAEFELVSSFTEETERGEGGFGHTGK